MANFGDQTSSRDYHPYMIQKVVYLSILYIGSTVYSQALYKLVTAAYLKPSTMLSHVSPRDKRIKYEAEEKAKISGFPTAKELREARDKAQARLKREEEEAEKVGLVR
jgi:DNA-directed RNA polymerase III subunit RPC3